MLAMRLLLALAAALVLAQPAEARISLGVLGNSGRFASQTGQHSEVRHVILGWGQGASWGARLSVQFASHGPVPLVAFTTSRGWPHREAIVVRTRRSRRWPSPVGAVTTTSAR